MWPVCQQLQQPHKADCSTTDRQVKAPVVTGEHGLDCGYQQKRGAAQDSLQRVALSMLLCDKVGDGDGMEVAGGTSLRRKPGSHFCLLSVCFDPSAYTA